MVTVALDLYSTSLLILGERIHFSPYNPDSFWGITPNLPDLPHLGIVGKEVMMSACPKTLRLAVG